MQHEYVKFLCVVEEGSFNDAAKKLHVSQPALSIAIKNLEKNLGTQLLYRSSKGVRLTEAGSLVYQNSMQMRTVSSNLMSRLSEELNSTVTLKLGVIDSVGDMLFGRGRDISDRDLEVTVDNSRRLLEMLQLDQLDLIVIAEPKHCPKGVQIGVLGSEEFKLVCKFNLANEIRQSIREKRLIPSFISYDKQSRTFDRITKQFKEQRLTAVSKFYSTSPELIKHMVLKGKGVALLPTTKVAKDISSGKLAELQEVQFGRKLVFATLVGKYYNQAMKTVIETVKGEL